MVRKGQHKRNPPLDEAIFLSMTQRQEDGCLLWLGDLSKGGYPRYAFMYKKIYVHRWAYEFFVEPIPEGYTIEHLCHDPAKCRLASSCPHRRCVEPTHLQPMTNAENSMRGGSPVAWKSRQTHCINEHPLEGDNLYVTPDGRRQCRLCRAEAQRRHWRQKTN